MRAEIDVHVGFNEGGEWIGKTTSDAQYVEFLSMLKC